MMLPPLVTESASLLAAAPAIATLLAATGASVARRIDSAWRLASAGVTAALLLAAALGAAVVLGTTGAGSALRLDGVGAVVTLLVAFIGAVIVRYSRRYLEGEPGALRYPAWLMGTIAAVQLVLAANHLLVLALVWTAASLTLQRLLVFFPERPAAVAAAHKKFLVSRTADVAMLAACALAYAATGQLRIDALAAQAEPPAMLQAAVVLIALAAVLKCAQLPFHGWLIQVMEAPTPVSALLHAGVVNLGGVVLIRFAPLVAQTPPATALLVVSGALTAVFAALVMTTRISIKVSLAWSTCAQMGFMLMQCGLGLWAMALLHLVAHSLYKAHCFLGAGGVVRQELVRRLAPAAPPAGAGALAAATLASLAAVGAAAALFGLHESRHGALWTLAGIAALAFVPLLRGDVGANALRGAAAAFALACVYFGLHALLAERVAPAEAVPAAPWWVLVSVLFAALYVLQSLIALHPQGTLARRLYPWFYGGLFLDERLSRVLFRLWPPRAST